MVPVNFFRKLEVRRLRQRSLSRIGKYFRKMNKGFSEMEKKKGVEEILTTGAQHSARMSSDKISQKNAFHVLMLHRPVPYLARRSWNKFLQNKRLRLASTLTAMLLN